MLRFYTFQNIPSPLGLGLAIFVYIIGVQLNLNVTKSVNWVKLCFHTPKLLHIPCQQKLEFCCQPVLSIVNYCLRSRLFISLCGLYWCENLYCMYITILLYFLTHSSTPVADTNVIIVIFYSFPFLVVTQIKLLPFYIILFHIILYCCIATMWLTHYNSFCTVLLYVCIYPFKIRLWTVLSSYVHTVKWCGCSVIEFFFYDYVLYIAYYYVYIHDLSSVEIAMFNKYPFSVMCNDVTILYIHSIDI